MCYFETSNNTLIINSMTTLQEKKINDTKIELAKLWFNRESTIVRTLNSGKECNVDIELKDIGIESSGKIKLALCKTQEETLFNFEFEVELLKEKGLL